MKVGENEQKPRKMKVCITQAVKKRHNENHVALRPLPKKEQINVAG